MVGSKEQTVAWLENFYSIYTIRMATNLDKVSSVALQVWAPLPRGSRSYAFVCLLQKQPVIACAESPSPQSTVLPGGPGLLGHPLHFINYHDRSYV
jgi:hypothetical protein